MGTSDTRSNAPREMELAWPTMNSVAVSISMPMTRKSSRRVLNGASHSKIDDRQAFGIGGRLHRPPQALDFALELLGEALHVIVEIGQKNIIAQRVNVGAGVTRQPVAGDIEFGREHSSWHRIYMRCSE